MPHDGRDLLHGHLERSFSGQQDVTPSGGSENGSEQRAGCIADRTPDKRPCDIGAVVGQSQSTKTCARCSVFDNDHISGTQKTLHRLPIGVLREGIVRGNEGPLLRRTSRLFLRDDARRRVNQGPQQLRQINSLIILICRIDVVGIEVDGRSGQFVGEKTSRRFDAPVTNRQQTITSFNCLARCGGAGDAGVCSHEMRGRLGDGSFRTVQRRDPHLKSLGEFHDRPGDAEADRIQIQ